MDILPCPTCGMRVFPESSLCANGHPIAYDPLARTLIPADSVALCSNRENLGCSWVATEPGGLCRSCATTTVIPDLSAPGAQDLFAATEAAKRWVFVGLLRLGWFDGPDPIFPEFQLLSEKIEGQRQKVMMGHMDGVITLNIMEADPATALRRKQQFDEPIRSMIGHVRHEIAHFLFDRLGEEKPGFLPAFRNLMGDERADYGQALEVYYQNGPSPDWPQFYISAYASAHPHEDWAEHAAHAMHLEDMAQSSEELGIELRGESIIDKAQNSGLGLNHMCRALGQPDPYPMVISPEVRQKLDFALGWLDRR